MWMIVMRAPRTAHAYWPGRRLLGAVDAVAWPALICAAALQLPTLVSTIVGQLLVAFLVLTAVHRVALAVWRNERFSFTTSRVAYVVAMLMLIGLVMKTLAVFQ